MLISNLILLVWHQILEIDPTILDFFRHSVSLFPRSILFHTKLDGLDFVKFFLKLLILENVAKTRLLEEKGLIIIKNFRWLHLDKRKKSNKKLIFVLFCNSYLIPRQSPLVISPLHSDFQGYRTFSAYPFHALAASRNLADFVILDFEFRFYQQFYLCWKVHPFQNC